MMNILKHRVQHLGSHNLTEETALDKVANGNLRWQGSSDICNFIISYWINYHFDFVVK